VNIPSQVQVQTEIHVPPVTQPKTKTWGAAQNLVTPQKTGACHLSGQVNVDFYITNDKALREDIEIAFGSTNGTFFRDSVTLQEAKHIIYKVCLGFINFSNFD
jgi:hypothetical protein